MAQYVNMIILVSEQYSAIVNNLFYFRIEFYGCAKLEKSGILQKNQKLKENKIEFVSLAHVRIIAL